MRQCRLGYREAQAWWTGGKSTAPNMAETDIPSHGYWTAPIIYQAAMDYSFFVGPHQAALGNHSLEIKLRLALCKANTLPAVLSSPWNWEEASRTHLDKVRLEALWGKHQSVALFLSCNCYGHIGSSLSP